MTFDIQRLLLCLSLLGLFTLPACVDQEFEEPPTTGSPLEVEATTTIQELKDLYIPGKPTEITEEVIIRGVVTANDRSGNFYRTFYMQDSTAGIEVQIALTNAYNFYIEGRELAIDCQGLVLGEYNGVIYLGGYLFEENGGQDVGLIVDYNQRIFRGELVGTPEPVVRTINTLGPDDISRLVKLENVEFAFQELGLSYADPIGRQTLNRSILDCDGNEIVLRTSGFSTFAADTVAEGNGSIVGIYSVFRDTKQFFVRDTEDISFNGARCNGGTGEESLMTIRELRDAFIGGATSGPQEKKIRGVVISDKDAGNVDARNLFIQDETAGIVVRFQNDHNFALNEEIEVVVSGQELSEFNGLMQVNFVNNELASSQGSGTSPTPREATVNEVLANLEAWESTLVEIKEVSITGGGTFAGAKDVNDGSGTIDLYTDFDANFANTGLPTEPVDMVAIVSQFNGPQLLLRNISDVGGEPDTGGGDPQLVDIMDIRELFESGVGTAPPNSMVRGVVVSDKDNGNFNEQNMVLQGGSGGAVIRFSSAHNFSYGEEVEVVISGQELSEFNGIFQINGIELSSATSFGNGTLPTPQDVTIAEVLANFEDLESTVVRITDVSFTDTGTFAGPKTLSDGTASITTFTRNDATFAGQSVPSGSFTLTAVVSQFNDEQLTIRNLNDIQQ